MLSQVIEPYLKGASCLYWHVGDSAIDRQFQGYAVKLLEEVKRLLLEKSQKKVLVQVVTSSPILTGLAGMLKTMTLEHPRIAGQLILVEPGESVAGSDPHPGKRRLAWRPSGALRARGTPGRCLAGTGALL